MPNSSPAGALTRRALLQQTGLGVLSLAALGSIAPAAESTPKKTGGKAPAPIKERVPLNRFGQMMQNYYTARIRAVEQQGIARRAALRS